TGITGDRPMKFSNAFAFSLLVAAGCSTYRENQATYSSPTYPTYGGTRVRPGYSTTTVRSSQVLADTARALVSTVRPSLNNSPTVAPIAQSVYISSRDRTVTLTSSVQTEQDRQHIDTV